VKKYIVKILFLIIIKNVNAQQFPVVSELFAKVLNNGTVRIDFKISTSIQLLNGCELQRSNDSAFGYINVYTYFGSVGGNTERTIFYEDYPPDPTKIYYYKVRFSNGSESKIIRVNMADVFGEYKIIPQPLTDNSRLEFIYQPGQQWILEIADPKGYFNYRDLYVYTGSYLINRSIFKSNGIYFFRLYLSDGSKVITGKIIAM
jgi:hypothetical protein